MTRQKTNHTLDRIDDCAVEDKLARGFGRVHGRRGQEGREGGYENFLIAELTKFLYLYPKSIINWHACTSRLKQKKPYFGT